MIEILLAKITNILMLILNKTIEVIKIQVIPKKISLTNSTMRNQNSSRLAIRSPIHQVNIT